MAKRIYVSYFCCKQNRLTVVSSPNINLDGCKLSALFKENLYDNFIINSLSTSRRFHVSKLLLCLTLMILEIQ